MKVNKNTAMTVPVTNNITNNTIYSLQIPTFF